MTLSLGSEHRHLLTKSDLGTAATICPTVKPRLFSTWQNLWKDQRIKGILAKTYLSPWKGQWLIVKKTYSKCIFSVLVLTTSANAIFLKVGLTNMEPYWTPSKILKLLLNRATQNGTLRKLIWETMYGKFIFRIFIYLLLFKFFVLVLSIIWICETV